MSTDMKPGGNMENSLEDTFNQLRYRIETDLGGTIRYYNAQNRLHREEGPAVIYTDGTKKWFHNGTLHREDGPAVIEPDGTQFWYINGKFIKHE